MPVSNAPSPSEPTDATPYILYAEDNPSDATFFQRAFRQAGGELPLVHFDNGVGIMDFLAEKRENRQPLPRLLILDIKMPGMSGLEVLGQLREVEEFRHLPVIMLSASYEVQDLKRAYKSRVNAYIVKPNRYTELKELTASIVAFWGHFNQLPNS